MSDPSTRPDDAGAAAGDPRDPVLFRTGLASARAALREGVARRHDRESVEHAHDLEPDFEPDLEPEGGS